MTDTEFRGVLSQVGLTKAALSRLLNVSRSTVHRWSIGEEIPTSAALLLRLLEGRRVSLDDLEAIRNLWEAR